MEGTFAFWSINRSDEDQTVNVESLLPLPSSFFLLNACLHFPQCSLIVTSNVSSLSTTRLRSIKKYQTPVVGMDYVYSCVERGVLLPVDDHKLDASSPPELISTGASSSSHVLSHGGHIYCASACMRG